MGFNDAAAEFFNVSLNVQWHETHGLTEQQVQQKIKQFSVVEKYVGRIDRYECKEPVALQSPEEQQNMQHDVTIYFCKRCEDATYSVVVTQAQQKVSYSQERFNAKKTEEQSRCWDAVRDDELQQSLLRYVHWITPYKLIDWWCDVRKKSGDRATVDLEKRVALESNKLHEDSAIRYALYTGLQTRKLICNGQDDIMPVVLSNR